MITGGAQAAGRPLHVRGEESPGSSGRGCRV